MKTEYYVLFTSGKTRRTLSGPVTRSPPRFAPVDKTPANRSPSQGDQAQSLLIPGRWGFPARPLNYSDSYILPQEPWGTPPFTGEPRHPQPLAFTPSPSAAPV